MKTVNVSELEGVALDYAVAVACGLHIEMFGRCFEASWLHDHVDGSRSRIMGTFRPSADWSHGGPLIDRHVVSLTNESSHWSALSVAGGKGCASEFGPTPLIAACRAIVAAKMGDTVDVPEELL